MSSTMRGAVLHGDRTVQVVEVDRPEPGTGEVLIRVEANGICGSDLNSYRGQHPRARFPKLFGHEVTGRVEAAGPGADAALVDQRVAVESDRCCGTCRFCQAGLSNICPAYRVIGDGPDLPGGCAEYITAPVSSLHVLPPSASAIDGAVVQPLAISYEGVVRRAAVQTGDNVLIVGAGPIGLGTMQLARLEGARVVMTDLVDSRLETARALGADLALRADDPDLAETVVDWTGGHGVDVAVEAVGGTQAQSLADAVRLTSSRGRLVVLGTFASDAVTIPVGDIKRREISVLGSSGHPGTFRPVIDHIAAGRLRPAGLVSHVVGLDELPEAFAMLDERRAGVMKIVVAP